MPDPGSPWERENPGDGFGYLPWPIRTDADRAAWKACFTSYALPPSPQPQSPGDAGNPPASEAVALPEGGE